MDYKRNLLFDNRHIENLTSENDLFGLIPKGEAISNILSNMNDFKGNNMIALYGNWGSGKTSLMYYIKNTLENSPQKRIKTIVFEAWKYEKDQNLGLSLLEQIKDEIENDNKIDQDIKNKIMYCLKIGITFAKNFLYNSKLKLATKEIEIAEFDLGCFWVDTEIRVKSVGLCKNITKPL